MVPILLRVGSYTVYSYTLSLVAGMIAGTWMAYRLARERLSTPAMVLDAAFWGLLGGLLGGRAGYVAANWAYYADHVGEAVALWKGGLAWHGALIGGCACVAAWFVVRSRYGPPMPDWRDLADAIAPGVALGGALGWLGCLLTGSAYGAEATGYGPPLSWFTADLPDIYGVDRVRFLTQPLMIAWCLLLWGLLWGLRRRLPRGLSFALYLLLYALADFGVAFVRGDGTWRLGLWLSQWVSIVEAGVAVGLGTCVWTRPDRMLAMSCLNRGEHGP
jgi:phosphatidylglycerol:prolipoprotein diacylglycerol transferase